MNAEKTTVPDFHGPFERRKSTPVVDTIARAIKFANASPDKVLELIAHYGVDVVGTALQELQVDGQTQLTEVNARWAAYKGGGYRPSAEFGAAEREYQINRAKLIRYHQCIITAVSHLKAFKREQANQPGNGNGAEWQPGDRVTSVGVPTPALGTIVQNGGNKSVCIVWDKLPGIPMFYPSPWSWSVQIIKKVK